MSVTPSRKLCLDIPCWSPPDIPVNRTFDWNYRPGSCGYHCNCLLFLGCDCEYLKILTRFTLPRGIFPVICPDHRHRCRNWNRVTPPLQCRWIFRSYRRIWPPQDFMLLVRGKRRLRIWGVARMRNASLSRKGQGSTSRTKLGRSIIRGFARVDLVLVWSPLIKIATMALTFNFWQVLMGNMGVQKLKMTAAPLIHHILSTVVLIITTVLTMRLYLTLTRSTIIPTSSVSARRYPWLRIKNPLKKRHGALFLNEGYPRTKRPHVGWLQQVRQRYEWCAGSVEIRQSNWEAGLCSHHWGTQLSQELPLYYQLRCLIARVRHQGVYWTFWIQVHWCIQWAYIQYFWEYEAVSSLRKYVPSVMQEEVGRGRKWQYLGQLVFVGFSWMAVG